MDSLFGLLRPRVTGSYVHLSRLDSPRERRTFGG